MPDPAFTYDRYRSYLETLCTEGFAFRTYGDDLEPGDVLLRHDIDLSPAHAVEMAEVEAELDIRATYFFLLGTALYNPFHHPTREAIRDIADLGHDIGLHFSTHQYWNAEEPPPQMAVAQAVLDEQEVLSTVAPRVVSTVSFHVPPSWVLRRRFQQFPSTYEPRFFEAIQYHADSGQRWRDSGIPVPGRSDPAQVLTHPGLWGHEDRSFAECVEQAVTAAGERAEEYAASRYLESTSGRVSRSPIETPDP